MLATTFLIAAAGIWICGTKNRLKAKHRRKATKALDANAQAVTLEPIDVQSNSGGTDGYVANSTSVATKTNTPLINIPQSVSVVTKDFIKDQSFQSLTDVTRYVPGVAVHQGEGNRDELVIRGVDSSANFFVNGFRDDVQYFRDLYNTQSIEVLKGPSALTFGRGSGGGLVNRTLKEADGTRVYDVTVQTGSFWRPARLGRRGPGDQPERRGAAQHVLRRQRHVPRLRQARALRLQSDRDLDAERHHQGQAQLRIFSRRTHGRSRQSVAGE